MTYAQNSTGISIVASISSSEGKLKAREFVAYALKILIQYSSPSPFVLIKSTGYVAIVRIRSSYVITFFTFGV